MTPLKATPHTQHDHTQHTHAQHTHAPAHHPPAPHTQPTQAAIALPTSVKLYRMSTPDHECPWGLKAVNLLNEKGIAFEDIRLTTPEAIAAFKAQHDVATTPQIFFGDQRIGGYTDLAAYLEVQAEAADYSYTPVVALFSTAGLVALSTSLGLSGFMGISLSMLASLKLMDLDAFAESFAKYDLVTRRIKPYGKFYPFIELAVGLGFLSGIAPLATGIGSLVVGASGAVSVFKAVYIDKMALNCACIGGNSKAPLGIVSFAENAIMALMGATLIFSTATAREVESKVNLQPELAPVAQLQEEATSNQPDHRTHTGGPSTAHPRPATSSSPSPHPGDHGEHMNGGHDGHTQPAPRSSKAIHKLS